MSESSAPALKEMFNRQRLIAIAAQTAAVYREFDQTRFLSLATKDLDELSLMSRLRRVSECLHACLPANYPVALALLRQLAPRLGNGFVTLILPDYVALYGLDDYDRSMEALKFFTSFGSSEFGVRYFLRQDTARGLALMEAWSKDENDHVRRLASEGSRPRLPWSFRLEALRADPSPVKNILTNLRADPSPYVRKSVANHLNDITKDHPDWVMDLLAGWPLDQPYCAWIARHALRSLIKQGNRRALGLVGAGEPAEIKIDRFTLSPSTLDLGQPLVLAFRLQSTTALSQRLIIDYVIHYIKKAGGSSAKVFKLKTLTLAGHQSLEISRTQIIRDFTTRKHYAGKHQVEILVNGESLAQGSFIIR